MKTTSHKIKVRYSETVPECHPDIYAYALKAEIISAEDMDDHLFVFQRSDEDNEGNYTDEFIQIASPLDIEEIPVNAPNLQNNMPYFRTKEVTLWFRCVEDLKLAKDKIRDDLNALSRTYDTINTNPDNSEEETYG